MSNENEDSPVVKKFKEYGKELIHKMLLASPVGFIGKEETYSKVVQGFKDKHGWPSELTALEKTNNGQLREVYINRLHWMTARLTQEKITESVSGRPFIALLGKLEVAQAAYPGKHKRKLKHEVREPLTRPLPIAYRNLYRCEHPQRRLFSRTRRGRPPHRTATHQEEPNPARPARHRQDLAGETAGFRVDR